MNKQLLKKRETVLKLLLIPFLLAASHVPRHDQSDRAAQAQDPGWWVFRNDKQGFSLRLPPHIKINFRKSYPLAWSADNRMPFDYVNFRQQSGDAAVPQFELGVGVHWNRDRLATREFAEKKDEGLRNSGARIKMDRKAQTVVCGLKGVRDNFRLRQPSGWQSYSRVIIPYKDKFLVFLGTLGADKPVAEYERLYQKILDSVTMP